ncbi:MAG: glycosyl transferase, partial [Planctomycetota bacterium]|nr:glycosyl transferase [Planctomycetota bacterium]
IEKAKLASGNIVEDMQLGVDMALAGKPALVCDAARVTGRLPDNDSAALTQRRRWEHGHLRTLLSQTPRLVLGGLSRGRIGAVALGLDLAVPPLALLAALLILGWVGALVAVYFGYSITALAILTFAIALLATSALAAWFMDARDRVPLRSLLAAPLYILWKIPLYLGFATKPEKDWIRTARDGAAQGGKTS